MIIKILRTEAFFVLVATVIVYFYLGFYWLPLLLILFPDMFMVGYFRDNKLGAYLYNLGHTYIIPLILLGVSLLTSFRPGIIISLIWIAHIALDRTLGYGLKQITGFHDTHLGRIGKK